MPSAKGKRVGSPSASRGARQDRRQPHAGGRPDAGGPCRPSPAGRLHSRNPNPVGEKNKLLVAAAGSRYDTVHARYHPMLKRFADTVGFYDINILDAATGDGL